MRKGPGLAGLVLGFLAFSSPGALAAPDFEALGISKNPARSNYNDVKAFMQELSAKYPQNVKQIEIGASDSGEAIQALAIGNGPDQPARISVLPNPDRTGRVSPVIAHRNARDRCTSRRPRHMTAGVPGRSR